MINNPLVYTPSIAIVDSLVNNGYMDINAMRQQLAAEATRRGTGQPASNVAMSPNPSASGPMTPPSGNPTMPSQGDPFGGASAAMNGSQPMKGGTAIERALIKRMQNYPPA